MRQIIAFQVVPEHVRLGDRECASADNGTIYALTHDGVLWRQGAADGKWTAIEPPPDGNPFKPEMTQEKLLRRLKRGDGFPTED